MVRRYPIRSENIVAHIRKATQGRVALENTHPFVRELWGRYWVFAHNGTIKDQAFLRARTSPARLGELRGETDSELFFAFLLSRRIKRQPKLAARVALVAANGDPNRSDRFLWQSSIDALKGMAPPMIAA